jgi:hypothetical protein
MVYQKFLDREEGKGVECDEIVGVGIPKTIRGRVTAIINELNKLINFLPDTVNEDDPDLFDDQVYDLFPLLTKFIQPLEIFTSTTTNNYGHLEAAMFWKSVNDFLHLLDPLSPIQDISAFKHELQRFKNNCEVFLERNLVPIFRFIDFCDGILCVFDGNNSNIADFQEKKRSLKYNIDDIMLKEEAFKRFIAHVLKYYLDPTTKKIALKQKEFEKIWDEYRANKKNGLSKKKNNNLFKDEFLDALKKLFSSFLPTATDSAEIREIKSILSRIEDIKNAKITRLAEGVKDEIASLE